jgi:hypothetical protein
MTTHKHDLNHDLSELLKHFNSRLAQATVNDHHHHRIGLKVIKACLRQAARDISGQIAPETENAVIHAIITTTGNAMKAREVSVSVADFGGSLYVNVTLKLPGHPLETEDAFPDTRNSTTHSFPGKRVKESSRKRKAKDLQRLIEGIEFPEV